MPEIWKRIDEGNGDYYVSNMGHVMNMRTGMQIKPRPTKTGYHRIHLRTGSKRKDLYIHRLVAGAFCVHPEGCDVVNHIDNDVTNNRADNLEWTTQRENVYHGMRQGRYLHNAVPVMAIKDGKRYFFTSSRRASIETGCDHKTIINCCKGIFKQTKGYKWEYAEVGA